MMDSGEPFKSWENMMQKSNLLEAPGIHYVRLAAHVKFLLDLVLMVAIEVLIKVEVLYLHLQWSWISVLMEQKNYLPVNRQLDGINSMELPKHSSLSWDKLKTPLIAQESAIQEPYLSLMILLKSKLDFLFYYFVFRDVYTNYKNGEGSCFKKIVDFSKEKWVPAIGLFAGLLAVLFFSLVFVCCICYHDELKGWLWFWTTWKVKHENVFTSWWW